MPTYKNLVTGYSAITLCFLSLHGRSFDSNLFLPSSNFSWARLPEESLPQISFSADLTYGRATRSFDDHHNTTTLFGGMGDVNFTTFAHEQFATAKTTPIETNSDLQDIYSHYALTTNFKNQLASLLPFGSNYQMVCDGKLRVVELALSAAIWLPHNFYILGQLPLQGISISPLKWVARDHSNPEVERFVNENFNTVLSEFGYIPMNKEYRLQGPTDVAIGVGWQTPLFQGKHYLVKNIWWRWQFGGLIPLANPGQSGRDLFFKVPMGNQGHFGAYLNSSLEIQLHPNLTLGANMSTKTFFNKRSVLRLPHNPELPFMRFFYQNDTRVRLGNYSQGDIYFKAIFPDAGVAILLGYSLCSQEKTQLKLSKNGATAGFYNQAQAAPLLNLPRIANPPVPGALPINSIVRSSDYISQQERVANCLIPLDNYLINNDPKLNHWNSHVVHFGFSFQPIVSKDFTYPIIAKICFSQPVYGKRSLITHSFNGGVSASIEAKF